MTAKLVVLEPAAFASQAAQRVAREIRRVLQSKDRCALALSGGATPQPVYQLLAAALPGPETWSRVDLYFADERCVPPDHPASNFGMVRESLLDRALIPPGQVHRMEGERPDPDDAAAAYEAILPVRLDLLLLGLGEDGHIASLFPGARSLTETRRRVLAVVGPKPPRERLTITPPVIRDAGLTIGLVSGAGKAQALARVMDGADEAESTPGRLARAGLWIVDTAAATRLRATR
ncbi:MAG: 6-phosphogluconolactonase [Gemmatimonadales bacterium]